MADNNEVVTDVTSFDGDVPAILPDGWQEGDDLLPEGVLEDDAALLTDGPSDDELLAQLLAEDNADDGAPTTDGGQADTQDAGAQAGGQTDGSGPAVSASRKLTLKVNHQEQVVDISSMSDDDLRALLQKGYAFDAMKDAEDRRAYLTAYQEQLDAGMTEAMARIVAREAAGGKTYEVKDGQIVTPETRDATPSIPTTPTQLPANLRTTPPPGTQTRNLRAEVEQLRMLYPDVKEIPDEVAQAVSRGVLLKDAYLAYVAGQSKQAAANLRKENKTLRQNAANAQRAPVRGVSGGDTGKQKTDPYAEAFDAGWNWT